MTKPDDRLRTWAERMLARSEPKYTSAITLAEVQFVLQREEGEDAAIQAVEKIQKEFPEIRIQHLDQATLNQSLELRQKYGLSILDAIHAATAIQGDGRMASSDHAFDRIPQLTRINANDKGPENL